MLFHKNIITDVSAWLLPPVQF